MLTLFNDPAWRRNIGDRGIRTIEAAEQHIINGPIASYAQHGFGFCTVETRADQQPIGICGLAKRDYLDDPDIGFAFLPHYCGQGYAFEAATVVMQFARTTLALQRIVATVRIDNLPSQKLLEKLGLGFERMFTHPDGDRELKLYSIALA